MLDACATRLLLECDHGIHEAPDTFDADLHRVAGLHGPDARRGAGGDDVPREKCHDGRDAGHQLLDREEEVSCVGRLLALAVEEALDVDGAGVDVGGDARPQRAEAVEALAECQLSVPDLDVTGAHVVQAGVAQHILPRALRGDVACALLDDDGQLRLVVHPRGLGRVDDRVARADERRRGLEEDEGLGRHGAAHLLGVVAVVQPDADDLAGPERGQQHRLPDQVPRPAPPERAEGSAGVLEDVCPIQDAIARLARGLEPDDLHASPRTSCIEYRPGSASAMNRAARSAPRAKVSRLWARWVSSSRSPSAPKDTVCSPTTSPERWDRIPISLRVRSPGMPWRP